MAGSDNPQVGLLTETRGVARFPYRFLFPGPARAERYNRTVARRLVVETGQRRSDQLETTSLDWILVGHDHHISVWMLFVKSACNAGHPLCELAKTLVSKIKLVRMLQVGIEFTWKRLRK
jgi:hypothetical protein